MKYYADFSILNGSSCFDAVIWSDRDGGEKRCCIWFNDHDYMSINDSEYSGEMEDLVYRDINLKKLYRIGKSILEHSKFGYKDEICIECCKN